VAHAVLAKACSHAFAGDSDDDFAQAFDDAWTVEVARQQEDIDRKTEGQFGELTQWRSYETIRALTRKTAFEAAKTEGMQVIEREFRSPDGLVKGWPDRVIVTGDETVVEDFKSGAIFENEIVDGQRLKSSYERQVLIYAGLVGDEFGRPPELGRIIGLDGGTVEFSISPDSARAAVLDAKNLLAKYNEKVSSVETPEELATPGERSCGYCPHQPICEPHWKQASPSWQSYASIEGIVEARQEVRNGTVALRLKVQRGTVESGRRVVITGLNPRWLDVVEAAPGRTVRVAKVRRHGESFSASWYTSARVLPNSADDSVQIPT
jgi:hypothetical protein